MVIKHSGKAQLRLRSAEQKRLHRGVYAVHLYRGRCCTGMPGASGLIKVGYNIGTTRYQRRTATRRGKYPQQQHGADSALQSIHAENHSAFRQRVSSRPPEAGNRHEREGVS